MRDVHCCQVPTAAMETQYAAFHHPLHSNCYRCIAPKQVPKGCSSITMETTSPPLLLYCLLYCSVLACLFHGFPCEIKEGGEKIHKYPNRTEDLNQSGKAPIQTHVRTIFRTSMYLPLTHIIFCLTMVCCTHTSARFVSKRF